MTPPPRRVHPVAGGAGYIGSHALRDLLENGFDAFAFDNLTTGHAPSVP